MAKKKQKLSWIEKLKMGATGYIKEKYHSPAGRKHVAKQKRLGAPKTMATKGIERRLKAAGLTDAEIKKLR